MLRAAKAASLRARLRSKVRHRNTHRTMAIDSIQRGVARGMAAAVAFAMVAFAIAYFLQWPNVTNQASVALRLKLAALATMAPAAILLLCIARLAKHRFSTPQDIHGSALTD